MFYIRFLFALTIFIRQGKVVKRSDGRADGEWASFRIAPHPGRTQEILAARGLSSPRAAPAALLLKQVDFRYEGRDLRGLEQNR